MDQGTDGVPVTGPSEYTEAQLRLMLTMAHALQAEYERGLMTAEQLEWALEFISDGDAYDEEEVKAQWAAFESWRDQTCPGWRTPRPASPAGTVPKTADAG